MGCSGPSGDKWSSTLQTCVAGAPGQSCDGSNKTTCHYARTRSDESFEVFGGHFTEEGYLEIDIVGPLDALGIKVGEQITTWNGSAITPEAVLAAYDDPPTDLAAIEAQPGFWSLTLTH